MAVAGTLRLVTLPVRSRCFNEASYDRRCFAQVAVRSLPGTRFLRGKWLCPRNDWNENGEYYLGTQVNHEPAAQKQGAALLALVEVAHCKIIAISARHTGPKRKRGTARNSARDSLAYASGQCGGLAVTFCATSKLALRAPARPLYVDRMLSRAATLSPSAISSST